MLHSCHLVVHIFIMDLLFIVAFYQFFFFFGIIQINLLVSQLMHRMCMDIKGELRNRFNMISEERVKFSEQNSENLMKIGWKIRKLWHFEVSQLFTKHFLTSRYEYANERVDDVIASLFAIYFVHKFLKNSIFCPNLW